MTYSYSCPFCGQKIPVKSQTCPVCGNSLEMVCSCCHQLVPKFADSKYHICSDCLDDMNEPSE